MLITPTYHDSALLSLIRGRVARMHKIFNVAKETILELPRYREVLTWCVILYMEILTHSSKATQYMYYTILKNDISCAI